MKALTDAFARSIREFEGRELLEYRFAHRGILMWPMVRWKFLSRAFAIHHGFQTVHDAAPPLSLAARASHAFQAWRRRPGPRPGRFPILWFGSAVGAVVQKDGEWIGRVNDFLINERPEDTLLLEESFQRRFKWPRAVRNIRFHDFIRMRASFLSRLRRGDGAADAASARALIGHLRDRFPVRLSDGHYSGLEADLTALAARLPIYHDEYRRLFEKVRPSVVLLEDATYGTQSYILKWAREAGIRTAEFQHGIIVPSHAAYNFGPAAFEPEYRDYVPEFLLTHGGFWGANTCTPSAKVVIGNPHFTANLEKAAAIRPASAAGRMLIVSQGNVTDLLVRLTREILSLPGDFEIVFRLHPKEVRFADRYRALEGLPRVTISRSGDIYELIGSSDWIVGVASTTLFEAAGLSKPAFIYDTPLARLYIPETFGTWFADAGGLLAAIRKGPAGAGVALDSIWAGDWQGNYRRFLETHVGLHPRA